MSKERMPEKVAVQDTDPEPEDNSTPQKFILQTGLIDKPRVSTLKLT